MGAKPKAAGPGPWATFTESPLAVKAVLAGVVINRLGAFLSIFLVLYLTARGYSADQAALALGGYGAGGVAGVLVGGALANALGARNATVLSMTGSALLLVLVYYVHSYPLIVASVVLVGLFQTIYRPAAAALLSELTPADRQVMVFGIWRLGLNLGTTLCPQLGFGLYRLGGHGYGMLFWGEAVVAVAYAVLAFATLPGKAGPGAGAVAGAAKGERESYLRVLRDTRYVFFLIASLANAIIYSQYLSTLPLDVARSGVDVFWYSLAVSVNSVIVIAVELPLTKVTQKWPVRITAGCAFALVGLGEACYGLPLGAAVILIGTLIWTLGEILGGPTMFAYPGLVAPDRLKARYISSFQLMFTAGTAIGPVVGGVLFQQLHHGVWPVVAVFAVFSTVFGVLGIRPIQPLVAARDPEAQTEPVAETV
ncbi:MFS transporter [Kitasatospora viridis]|uniref:Putative MFS family arabinose efflux permease n=1 Tax=Kitasatospora viridis TaxID=281105 RepID=A0A561UNR0_9ACTN|nr:MFS transporter [Kitasatospora viridis]TWG01005.1 putative MFS family arabinose efflux permease [Kitasatospora viridis]